MIHITDPELQKSVETITGDEVALDYASVLTVSMDWSRGPGLPAVRALLHYGISLDKGKTFRSSGIMENVYLQKDQFAAVSDQVFNDDFTHIHPTESGHYWIEKWLVVSGRFGAGAEIVVELDTVKI